MKQVFQIHLNLESGPAENTTCGDLAMSAIVSMIHSNHRSADETAAETLVVFAHEILRNIYPLDVPRLMS